VQEVEAQPQQKKGDLMELTRLPLKLQAAAMTLLMVATCFAAVPANTTLLQAYTRHAIQASQDLVRILPSPATTTSKAIASDHLIRLGRHIQSLNEHLDEVEKAILANQDRFVHGDWSQEIHLLQERLTRMGYKAKLVSPDAPHRARLLASIKQHGLRGHLHLTGSAVELKGDLLVSPFAKVMDPYALMDVDFNPIRPACAFWQEVGAGWMALGAVAMLGTATAPLGTALAAAGGLMWLVGTYAPALC
jgi:hypothetical protein